MSVLTWTTGQPAAQEAAEHAAEAGGGFDLGELIMHHLTDSHELELPLVGPVHLPTGWLVDAGPLGVVDLAPTKHVVLMVLAALLCVLFFLPLARVARRRDERKAPVGMGGAIGSADSSISGTRSYAASIGHGADTYTPFILTLFFFILSMNLLGLVPWGGSATGNLSVTAALAFCSFIVIEVSGMRGLGPRGYLRTIFFAPEGMTGLAKAVMLLIFTPVELLGKLTKPFALTIRLFANMTAGHTLIFALGRVDFRFYQHCGWRLRE